MKLNWKPSQYKIFSPLGFLLGCIEEKNSNWHAFYSNHQGVLISLEECFKTKKEAKKALWEYILQMDEDY